MNIDIYKHMDKDDKISFSMTETVKSISNLNYGQQRLLAEIVIQREQSGEYEKYESCREHTQQLRELLENGWY